MCPYGHIAPKPLLAMYPYKKLFFSKIRYKKTKAIKNCYFIYYLGLNYVFTCLLLIKF